jgi:hypothetical protein
MEPSSILTLSPEVFDLLVRCALLTLCGWVVCIGLVFAVEAMLYFGDSSYTTLKQYAQDASSWTQTLLLGSIITFAIWLLAVGESGLLNLMPFAFICVITLVAVIVILTGGMVVVLVVKLFTPNKEPKYLPAK